MCFATNSVQMKGTPNLGAYLHETGISHNGLQVDSVHKRFPQRDVLDT